MEREVAAMATRLESSVGLKRKQHIPEYMLKFADDFRDVEIKGGMVAIDAEGRKVSFDDIELPKAKGGEAESGSKTKGGGSKEEGSYTTAKPAAESKTKGGATAKPAGGSAKPAGGSKTKGRGSEEGSSTTAKPAGVRKRTKKVKYTLDKSLIPLFSKPPIPFDLSRHGEGFATALRNYLKMERNILEQFKTKGYAEYEREVEVTDDEEDRISV